jgi:hypothetical protein
VPIRTRLPRHISAALLAAAALAAPAAARAQAVTQVLEIGGDDVDRNYVLVRVADIAVSPAGAIYVADAGDRAVKVYDAAGRFVRRIGREGSGPGEFQHPAELRLDTVLRVYDGAQQRVSVFSPDGAHRRTDRLPTDAVPAAVSAYPLRGRLALATAAARFSYGGPPKENRPNATLWLLAPGRPASQVASFGSGGAVWHARGQTVPWGVAVTDFGTAGAWAVDGDSLVAIADGYEGTVRWLRATDSGLAPVRTAALPSRSRAVTAADLREAEAEMRRDRSGLPPRIELVAPARWSVASRAFFAPGGELWVRNSTSFQRGSVWTVFTRDGAVRLHFTLPPGFDLRAVRGNLLYGVRATENGSATVRVLELSTGRPAPGPR